MLEAALPCAKEVTMANVKDMRKGICDDVYTELAGMKEKIEALTEKLKRTYPAEDALSGLYSRHLHELAGQIEWRLQILSHACPHDWKGSEDYEENIVSVGPPEKFETDFSGGYVGG
jgi:hypothetical protein